MKIIILRKEGVKEALYGLSLSYKGRSEDRQVRYEQMRPIAEKLRNKSNGEDSFLGLIVLWLEITAPRYWWVQMDRYNLSQLSESTMHTLMRRVTKPEDYSKYTSYEAMDAVNAAIVDKNFEGAKANLPEGYLQTRVVLLSLRQLVKIYNQRKDHRLTEWKEFCAVALKLMEELF